MKKRSLKTINKVRVGTAGWDYPDWKGTVYPLRPPRGFKPLTYLSSYLDLIEINSTFYRPPRPAHVVRWLEAIDHNDNFRFNLKLFRGFTHDRILQGTSESEQWDQGVEPLLDSGYLGAFLAQFPYSFHFNPENTAYLSALRERFPLYPLAVEFRHSSWADPVAIELLRDLSLAFCNIDQPQISHSLGPSSLVTSDIGYVRLHGRNVRDWFRPSASRDHRYNYLYNQNQVDQWEQRIVRMADETKEIFVIANNHYRGQAVCNALQIRSGLEERRVCVPPVILKEYPQLKGMAKI